MRPRLLPVAGAPLMVTVMLCSYMAVSAQQTQNEEPHNAVGFRSSELQIAMGMKKAGRLPEV